MTTISLCMVVENQSEQFAVTLEALKDIADEMIIVITGDDKEIRKACNVYTTRIYNFAQSNDPAASRNYSFSMAAKDHILWLDPFETISDSDRIKLSELKSRLDDSVDAVKMACRLGTEEKGTFPVIMRPRIVKRNKYFRWQDGLKGYLPVTGNVISSDIVIVQNTPADGRTRPEISVYEYRLESGERLTPKELYYYAENLFAKTKTELAMEYYKEFLKEKDGWTGDKLSSCERLAEYYRQKGDSEGELKYTFKSFEYDFPRAEFLCRLGTIFTERNEDRKAIFWYNTALSLKKPEDNLGYIREEYWNLVPHLKLAGCYYRLGEFEKAYKHNETVLNFRPGDPNLLHNRSLLESLIKTNKPQVSLQQDIKRPLKIVQVAPDVYPVPPENYGGIENIVYEITEGLVKMGHEVILYAPPGSKTSAKLLPYTHPSKGDSNSIAEFVLKTLPEDTDIIHDHTLISVLGKRNLNIPTICTIHGTINYRVDYPVFLSKRALEVIGQNHGFYVYNGLNLKEYEYCEQKDGYMLYLGRLDKYKGIELALDIADRTNKKLVIAGPVHDNDYYTRNVEPRIRNNPNIKYIGSVGGKAKQEVLKHAECLLFPTCWEEPFGLVMIEAMACGTPVIALSNGAVPEVLREFPDCICKNIDEMVRKVLAGGYPEPRTLREYAVSNFSTEKMVGGYLEVYEKVIAHKKGIAVQQPDYASVNIQTRKKEHLSIVQVAPDAFPVPPKDYGGIERVVYDLTEELVRKGHEVYLFAAEGSKSSAKIIPYPHKGSDVKKVGEFVKEKLPERIDIIHDHTHSSIMDQCGLNIPVISTIHDSRKNTARHPVYLCRKALQNVGLNQGFSVYNGVNTDDYEFSDHKEDYLIFMGLLYSHKGITHAMDVAEKTGQRLVIAGPIYSMEYYKNEIEPRVKNNRNITYLGSVGGKERQSLLKHARCMLFPTVWEEPFGLVMIEAMACGTPVLAFGNGAVPEVLVDFPGLICKNSDEMALKVENMVFPEPKILREYVKSKFSAAGMADAYLDIYRKIINRN